MSAFTPGPWLVRPALWGGVTVFHEGPGVFSIEDAATETVICDRRTPWPEKADEMAANARLIACAPDFYTEALRMVERHDEAVRKVDLEHCSCANCTPFRALIARANGEKV